MSFTPSLTPDSSDRDHPSSSSTEQSEVFSSLQQTFEYYHTEFDGTNVHSSDQQPYPSSGEYLWRHFGGTGSDSYSNAIDLRSTGSWMGDGQAERSSAEGSRLLEAQRTNYRIRDALSPPFPSRLLASREPHIPRALVADMAVGNFTPDTFGYPARHFGERSGTDGSGKKIIDRAEARPASRTTEKILQSFSCPHDGCKTTCKRAADLKRHINDVHKRGTVFVCAARGCLHSNRREDKMKEHCRGMHSHASGSEAYSSVRPCGQ